MSKVDEEIEVVQETDLSEMENSVVPVQIVSEKTFYNYKNQPPKVQWHSENPTKTQESPLDAKSPQEVLAQHGMYKQDSAYAKHPEKIYGDFTEFGDFESIHREMRIMQEKFNALDIDVRANFNHDVNQFAKYLMSPDFSIEKVLSKKELEKYNDYKKEQEYQKKYNDYINSKQYKDDVAEQIQRQAYEKAKYDEWKQSNKQT